MITFGVLENDIKSENWASLNLNCKTFLNSPNSSTENLCQFLLEQSILQLKNYNFPQSLVLRKMIDTLDLKLSEENLSKVTYEYFSYAACALREKGYLKKAKILTEKALKLCEKYDYLLKSMSFMNMCAIYSALDMHDKALQYARQGLDYIYEELLVLKQSKQTEKLQDKYVMISIACFNLAVEEEYFRNFYNSLFNYNKSLDILNKFCPDQKELIEKVKNSIKNIKLILNPRPTTPMKMVSNRSYTRIKNNSPIIDKRIVTSSAQKYKKPSTATPQPHRDLRNISEKYFSTRDSQRTPVKIIKSEQLEVKFSGKNDKNAKFDDKKGKSLDKNIKIFEKIGKKIHKNQEKVIRTQISAPKIKDNEMIKGNSGRFSKIVSKYEKSNEQKLNTFESFGKIEPVTQEIELNIEQLNTFYDTTPIEKSNLPKVIKIQSSFRRYLSIQRYKLLKSSKELPILKRWKLLNRNPFLIVIKNSNNLYQISAISSTQTYSLEIPNNILIDEVYEQLNLNSSGLYLKTNHRKNKIFQIEHTIDKNYFLLEFFKCSKILVITAKNELENFSMELFLNCHFSSFLTWFIVEKIIPNLSIVNSKLIFSEFQIKCIGKGDIFLNKSLAYVKIMQNDIGIDYYVNKKIAFSIPPKVNSEVPIILRLNLKKDQYLIRPLKKIHKITTEKLLMNNGFEYLISVYSIVDDFLWYYFEAVSEDSPIIGGISLTEKDLQTTFAVKSIKKHTSTIIKRLIIINRKLDLQSSTQKIEKFECDIFTEKLILKIQSIYRGNRTRDMLKLQKFHNELVISQQILKNNIEYHIKIFKISSHLLIEVFKPAYLTVYYKFIINPLHYISVFYKFSNLKILINAIKLDPVPYLVTISGKNHFFIESHIDSEEILAVPKFQLRMSEKILILAFLLYNKSVLIKVYDFNSEVLVEKKFPSAILLEILGKFDPEKIMSQIKFSNNEISVSENFIRRTSTISDVNEKYIYRTCIKIMNVLYQVTVSLNGQNLKFMYKRGSFMGLGIDFVIDLNSACERFGFNDDFLIPMINYMIKKVLVLKDDEIVINSSKNCINIDLIISKIQAAFRSYALRKRFKDILLMKLCLKAKKALENAIYSIFLFEKQNDYLLCAVNGHEVLRKYIPKPYEHSLEFLIKSNINDLFIINNVGTEKKNIFRKMVRSINEKTFLTENSVSKIILWAGKGTINAEKVNVLLYDVGKFEILECHFTEKVLSFEIDPNYLVRNSNLFTKIQVNKEIDLDLKINQKKMVMFQNKNISGYDCRIQAVKKKSGFKLIILMIKEKRFIIKYVKLRDEILKIIERGIIQCDAGNYNLFT